MQQTGETIVYLKMKNNQMADFPGTVLRGLLVRHLVVHKCSIRNISQDAFAQLTTVLESIDLSENMLNTVPQALRGLASLVSLNLNFNQIEVLEANAFEGLVSLLRLSLFGNRIRTIDWAAFSGMSINFTRINLGGNRLQTVPSDALRDLKLLQVTT